MQPWWEHGPDKLELGTVEMGKATGIRFGEFTPDVSKETYYVSKET